MKKILKPTILISWIQLLFVFTLNAQTIKPELVVQTGQAQGVSVFSPNKQLLASAMDKNIKLFDVKSGRELKTLGKSVFYSVDLKFSPDSKMLASYEHPGKGDIAYLTLWEVLSGKKLWSREVSWRGFEIEFSSDSEVVLLKNSEKFEFFYTENKEVKRTEFNDAISADFHPTKPIIATVNKQGKIQFWKTDLINEVKNVIDYKGIATKTSFSKDGNLLAIADKTAKKISVWDETKGKFISNIPIGSKEITSLGFDSKGSVIYFSYLQGVDDVVETRNLVDGRLKHKIILPLKANDVGDYLIREGESLDRVFSAVQFDKSNDFIEFQTNIWDIGTLHDFSHYYDLKTGKKVSIENERYKTCSFAPSLDWSLIAFETPCLDDKTSDNISFKTVIWDNVKKSELHTLENLIKEIKTIQFSPNKDNKTFVVGTNSNVKTLGGNFPEFSVNKNYSISPDNKYLARINKNKRLEIIDIKSGEIIEKITYKKVDNLSEFNADSKLLAKTSDKNEIRIIDKSGRELYIYKPKFDYNEPKVIKFSPDGKTLAFADSGQINFWNLETNQQKGLFFDFKNQDGEIQKNEHRVLDDFNEFPLSSIFDFSPDSKTFAYVAGDYRFEVYLRIVNAENGKILFEKEIRASSVKFSPDGKTIAVGGGGEYAEDTSIRVFDVQTGKELYKLKGHSGNVKMLSFSSNGKLLISGSSDTSAKVWNLNTKQNVASLYMLKNSEWAVITPNGLYDASPKARDFVHYTYGLEIITLEQMKELYYVPNLLTNILNGKPLPKVELFSKKDLFPNVEFKQQKDNPQKLDIFLTNRGGGIGQVQVLVNGKQIIADARPENFNPNSKEAKLIADLKDAPFVQNGENKIEVIAKNASGSLNNSKVSRGVETFKVASNQDKPTEFYAIVGGVSDYTGDTLDLNFAAKDAENIAQAISAGASKLFGEDKVHIRLLTSNANQTKAKLFGKDTKIEFATKTNFKKAFSEFKQAKPNDIFLVYLAGHGVSYNFNTNKVGGDTYLYLTQEATTTNKSVLSDEKARNAMSISTDELVRWVTQENKALKQALILDTCAAGAAIPSLFAKRDLPADQIRALERLKDQTGFFVLMGSAADAVSYEATTYGQGLLTYSILQALNGAKLREDSFANIGLLFEYAQTEVPKMAKNIGGVQRPEIIVPKTSNSFDIGQFTKNEQTQINLANPKPLFLRPSLQNKDLLFDNLELSSTLKKALRETSFASIRGESPNELIFIDAEQMADAVKPSGSYSIDGENVKLDIVLVKNNKPFGKKITVNGKVNEKDELIKNAIVKILTGINKQ